MDETQGEPQQGSGNINGLPRRERSSLRETQRIPKARPRSAHETAEASRSFADDVGAFSAGSDGLPPTTSPDDYPEGPEGQMPR